MIADPSVLILDGTKLIFNLNFYIIKTKIEPTSGLDSFTAYLIIKLLRDLAKKCFFSN